MFKSLFLSFLSGFIFSIGLGISGMTNPDKVKGFLDILGQWQIDLAFVMGSALVINFISYQIVKKMKKPLFEKSFSIPNNKNIDFKLIGGSSIFGLGWGISGFCPGPALASLPTLKIEVILFVISMIIGFIIYNKFQKYEISKSSRLNYSSYTKLHK
jgi:hypothetical protein